VAGVADRPVVEVAHLSGEGFAQGAKAPRGVERLIGDPIERERLAFLQRARLAGKAVDDRLARLAIFVDHAVGGPGQIVVERIGRIFRQGADAQADIVQGLETRGQVGGDDGDEAWGEATLGNERRARALGQALHLPRRSDVFGQIQIVGAGRLGRLGHQERQVIRRGAEHGELARQHRRQAVCISDVENLVFDIAADVELGQLVGAAVGDDDAVIAGGGEQRADRRADVAGPDDDDVFHGV